MKRYQAPEKQWLSGHRGIDLNVEEGEELLAPADGMIAFAGSAAGASPANALRRFPRLREGEGRERTLIDEVLDSLE